MVRLPEQKRKRQTVEKEPGISFEQSLARLEEIVATVENRDTSLDEAMNLYKEGISLAKSCSDMLGKYENEIMTLVKESDGSFTETPFSGQ